VSFHEFLDAIGEAVDASGDCSDSLVNACSSSGGSIRPRFDARRRMPAAARADRKNLGGALS
jgi:hypothetical protein